MSLPENPYVADPPGIKGLILQIEKPSWQKTIIKLGVFALALCFRTCLQRQKTLVLQWFLLLFDFGVRPYKKRQFSKNIVKPMVFQVFYNYDAIPITIRTNALNIENAKNHWFYSIF